MTGAITFSCLLTCVAFSLYKFVSFCIQKSIESFFYTIFTIVLSSLWINCSFNCIMLPDIDSTFFHVLCGNLIVSKGSLYVYLFELNLRNLLYVILQRQRIVTNLKIVQARGLFCDIIKEKSLKQSIMLKYNL